MTQAVHELSGHLGEIEMIAKEAGARILDVYEGEFDVENKTDGSPLTEADKASHHIIVDRLARLTPDVPVLSEESRAIGYATRKHWQCYWLIDPLDGTREFVKRNGEFTVNIALIENNKPVLGVVYVPVKDILYSASVGTGAIKEDSSKRLPINVRTYTGGVPSIVASRSHAGEMLQTFLDKVAAKEGKPEIVSMGSSLKLCLVAEGVADVYPRLGPTSEWDTAAAQCVVEAAGGQVLSLQGEPLVYNKENILNPMFLVVCNGGYDWMSYFHDYG